MGDVMIGSCTLNEEDMCEQDAFNLLRSKGAPIIGEIPNLKPDPIYFWRINHNLSEQKVTHTWYLDDATSLDKTESAREKLISAAVKSVIPVDLVEASLEDAITYLGIDISKNAHLFTVKVGPAYPIHQQKILIELSRIFSNVLFRLDVWEESELRDEWLLTHIESGKSYYSPGA